MAFPDTPIWWGLSSSIIHWRHSSLTKQLLSWNDRGFLNTYQLMTWWWSWLLSQGSGQISSLPCLLYLHLFWHSQNCLTGEFPGTSYRKSSDTHWFPPIFPKKYHKIKPLRHYRNQFETKLYGIGPIFLSQNPFLLLSIRSRPSRNWVSPLHRKSCRTSHRRAAEDCADSRRFRVQIWFSHGGLKPMEIHDDFKGSNRPNALKMRVPRVTSTQVQPERAGFRALEICGHELPCLRGRNGHRGGSEEQRSYSRIFSMIKELVLLSTTSFRLFIYIII